MGGQQWNVISTCVAAREYAMYKRSMAQETARHPGTKQEGNSLSEPAGLRKQWFISTKHLLVGGHLSYFGGSDLQFGGHTNW